jgi:hypothetical protein
VSDVCGRTSHKHIVFLIAGDRMTLMEAELLGAKFGES